MCFSGEPIPSFEICRMIWGGYLAIDISGDVLNLSFCPCMVPLLENEFYLL